MGELIIADHALKHGLSPIEIESAWKNYLVKQYRGAPNEGEIIVIGCDNKARLVEIVAAERSFGTIIFHAMTPPSANALRELGLKSKGRQP